MADVLEQSEIDALLSAATSGEDPIVDSIRPQSDFIKGIQSYDFRRPERVSQEQMRALEGLHETFARSFGASLCGFLRTIVEVRLATVEQLTYHEFVNSLPNPTNFNLMTAEPLEGQLCLELSPLIIYPIVDRLLGGTNADLFIPQRPLTLIEQRLVRRITDRAVQALSDVWSELVTIKFEITEVESNPQLVQIVAPNDVVVVIGFELRMAGRAGTMSLCIPFNVIEPVMNKLVTQGWLAYQRKATDEDKTEEIARSLGVTPVTLVAYLAQTTLSVREVLTLQPGDIIQTDKPVGEDVVIRVEGKNKFAGKLGKHRDAKAIRIMRRAQVEEPL